MNHHLDALSEVHGGVAAFVHADAATQAQWEDPGLGSEGQVEPARLEIPESAIERASAFRSNPDAQPVMLEPLLGHTHLLDGPTTVPAIHLHKTRFEHRGSHDGNSEQFRLGHHANRNSQGLKYDRNVVVTLMIAHHDVAFALVQVTQAFHLDADAGLLDQIS
jgi:hypothetical protein